MEKKENASKLISSLVALSLATTLGVPTIALADQGQDATPEPAAQQQAAEGASENGSAPLGASETPTAQQSENASNLPAADANGVITIAQSGTYSISEDTKASIFVNKDIEVTLNIASGKKLTNADGKHTITNNGTLTITGEGTVDNVSHGCGALVNEPGGTAMLNGCTFTRSKEAGTDKDTSGGNSWYTIKNYGTMTIGESTVVTTGASDNVGKYSSLIANGWQNGSDLSSHPKATGQNSANMTINGGAFSRGLNTVKNDDYGVLAIKGGTFTNYVQAALQNHGVATISNGNFNAASDYAVYNCPCDKNVDKGELSISGGDFKGTIYSVRANDYGFLKVTGGTFTDPGVYKYAESGTVNVNMNNDYNGSIVLRSGVTANLNLGGHTIQFDKQALDVYGNLTLSSGNVCVENSNPENTIAAIWVNKSAHLVVEKDATITATGKSFGIGYWSDCDSAEVTVKGTVKGANGITMNGSIGAETSNKLVLDGATIQTDGHAIYQAGGADTSFTLNNSSIIGGSTGIEVRAGNLSVNNCTITGGDIFRVLPNGNGTTTDGAGIAIAQHTTKQPINVVVNGGTISGKYALYESNPQNNDADAISQVKLSIAGGTFTGDIYSQDIDGFITGGTFSSKPDARYIASGYEAVGSDTYTVQWISSSTPAPAPTTETTTTTNPDGTTTTTVTDKKTGESTSTTEGANGTTVVEKTDASGNTTTKVTVPEGAATNAGAPVEIPAAVEVTKGKEVSISAPAGTIVAIPAAADAGNVAVIVHADGTETVIPMSLVEGGKAIVKIAGNETIKIIDNAKEFVDVPADHWAAGNIDFASSHEIFKGIGNGDTYEPETALTRNMMMTVLARTDGADTSDSDPWYAKGQQWAVDNGVSNGLWGEDSITREQLVTMLFNYANKSGMDTSARADLSGMKNADAVSDWALEAVQWAVAEGILKGVDNTDLAPQGLATRAQAAAFMQRYVKTALL